MLFSPGLYLALNNTMKAVRSIKELEGKWTVIVKGPGHEAANIIKIKPIHPAAQPRLTEDLKRWIKKRMLYLN